MHQVGEGVHLHERHQLGSFTMITAYLLQGVGNAFQFGGSFGFHQQDGDAVDEEGYIHPNTVGAVVEAQFIGDMVGVLFPIIRQQAYIALTLLLGDEDRLQAAQIFPGFQVALDARQEAGQAFCQVFGAGMVDDARIDVLDLSEKSLIEQQAVFAAAHLYCVFRFDVFPFNLGGIFD